MVVINTESKNFWRKRLNSPTYQVVDAARYARISVQTISNWQSRRTNRPVLPLRQTKASLSYLQLIELAVVAEFRKLGVKLSEIRKTREYVSSELNSKYPFAEFKFKTDGKALLMAYKHFDQSSPHADLVETGKQTGQWAWGAILNKLTEFDYEQDEIVARWRVSGNNSPIVIDPRIAFGAPSVLGVPTWTIKGRWQAKSDVADIADDYDLTEDHVLQALEFEGIRTKPQIECLN